MRQFLRAVSPTAELVIVILVAFGLPIVASFVAVFSLGLQLGLSDGNLEALLIYELATLTALSIFLRMRGWTLRSIGLEAHPRDILVGLALAVAVHFTCVAVWQLASSIFPQLPIPPVATGSARISLFNVTAACILNPLFEEIFVCGYVIVVLKERGGPWTAINVSVAIRLLYHMYQGAVGVVGIVPTGLIFAYWYARTGRLWPAVVAHGLLNFIALLAGGGT